VLPAAAALPVVGLAYAGRQITYGAGLDNAALPAPTIDAIGESYLGNATYAITLAGSVPGGTAFLRYSFGPACPPPFVFGIPVYHRRAALPAGDAARTVRWATAVVPGADPARGADPAERGTCSGSC
jgi:hypothetical protein